MWSNQMLYAAASIVSVAVWVINKKYYQEADAVVANVNEDEVSENLDGDSSEALKQTVDDALTAATRPSISDDDPSIPDGDVSTSLEQDDDNQVNDPIIDSVDIARPGITVGVEGVDHAHSVASALTKQAAVDPKLINMLNDFGQNLMKRSVEKKWIKSGFSKAYSVDQSVAQAENMDKRIVIGIATIIRSLQRLDEKSEDYVSRTDELEKRIQMYQNQSKPNRTPRGYVIEDLTAFAQHGLSLVYVQTKMDLLMQRLQEKKVGAFPLSDWEAIKTHLSDINARIDQASKSQQKETTTQVEAAFNAFKQGMDEVNQQIDQYLKVNLFPSSTKTVVANIAHKVTAIEDACTALLPIVISKPVLTSGDPLINRRVPTSLDRLLSIDTGMKDMAIHIDLRQDLAIIKELLCTTDTPVQNLKGLITQQIGLEDGVGFSDSFRAMSDILAQVKITLQSSAEHPINIVDACREAVQGRASVLYQQFNQGADMQVHDSTHQTDHYDFKNAIVIFTDNINALSENLDVLKSTEATTEDQVKALKAIQYAFHQWNPDVAPVSGHQPPLDNPNDSVGQEGLDDQDNAGSSKSSSMRH